MAVKSKMSEAIVDEILNELGSRKGFNHWWDDIDEDIQGEIEEALISAVIRVLNKGDKHWQ